MKVPPPKVQATARHHASQLVAIIAFLGVPIAVLILTGGFSTIGFWLRALILIPWSAFIVIPLGFFAALVFSPILFLFDRLIPDRIDWIVEKAATVFWVVLGTVGYVYIADLGSTSRVRLPLVTPWTNASALLVIVLALGSMWVLLKLSDRLEVPTPRTHPPVSPAHTECAEPEPGDEFWSPEPVVGWRAWRWTGTELAGVFAEWQSDQFRAICDVCDEVPSWNHTCGIYAVKDPVQVYRFPSSQTVIGRVEMWGVVIDHERGYRCSNARIAELWTTSHALAEQIRKRYLRVEVHVGSPLTSRRM